MRVSEVIKSPILTEKSYKNMELGIYTFKVDVRTNKVEVAKAVEFIFQVKVAKVNIIKVEKKPKKVGRFSGFVPSYKKAIVYLEKGNVINIFPEEDVKDSTSSKAIKKDKVVSEDKASEAAAKAAAKIAAKKAANSKIAEEANKPVRKVAPKKTEVTKKSVVTKSKTSKSTKTDSK
ncbi:LSU ribosomal protein L23P [Mycoplasma testudineum]|uniref:Large ribosomal subunit protein uL23 n=1 Tax=Mycoplasma testudineum TaxID=244584 RepID=A0A4R6IFH4_9MOLU|nr:50S ribosomal protein L23 [Mycoplasma testudineum]OYD27146.1 50S ribosomal protein L23 [Mycoplasma testudineum]TDO21100.1 LSU ribosomal protein L23P [Mycoplasma testudineum]